MLIVNTLKGMALIGVYRVLEFLGTFPHNDWDPTLIYQQQLNRLSLLAEYPDILIRVLLNY